ncbi:MAG: HAD-IIIC family phosphatase [Gammaproteobacteria bacterium]|nr:HAD-IIIC family phosphatase [Gammaproteobacteria bacterium]
MDIEIKKALRSCDSSESLLLLLQDVVAEELSPAEVEFIHHVIIKTSPEYEYTVAYLANHTIDSLSRYTSVYCAIKGQLVNSYIGGYGQYFQEVLEPGSGLIDAKPDMIFLSLLLRELAPKLSNCFITLTPQERKEEIDRVVQQLQEWSEIAKSRTQASILISNFVRPAYSQAGVADLQQELGEAEFYAELNLALLKAFRDDQRVFIFDMDHVLARYGKERSFNAKMYHLAKIEWDEAVYPLVSAELWRYIFAIKANAKKCLVLDLDNTLWGGIVGEDGVHGIKIGHGDAESEAYLDFQYAIRSLIERGIILAICSKNNMEDVEEVFNQRSEMVLQKEDFAASQVNWDYKYLNIQKIAAQLNIGIDSIVFVDDNPVECSLVKEALPEVTTVHLSGDPSKFTETIMRLYEFEKLFFTTEDKVKLKQYQQNAKREQQKQAIGNIDDYLKSLGTRVYIEAASKNNLQRLHQLFSKTNQFNVTTKRYTPSDIETFLDSDHWQMNIVQVKDKFGDLGIVGLYLVEVNDAAARIDSFVLSCRALGRSIESCIMNNIKQDFLGSGKCATLQAQFCKTAKNMPASTFFADQGFVKTAGDENEQYYEMSSDSFRLLDCPGIDVQLQQEEQL